MTTPVGAARVGGALGSRNEATRRHNLATLMTLVHRADGMSRSDLTRATGLNRSTIGALVSDLVDAGLVTEEHPETTGVGRPSPMVRPSRDLVALAVYPDVDAVSLALVGLGHRVVERRRVALDAAPSPAEVAALAAEAWAAWSAELGARCVGVGVAVPGLVRTADAVVARAPHLLWEEAPVGEVVSAALGLPAAVDNDANAGLIAESLFGAARGETDVIYLNGSTSGIGGAVGVGGVVLRGADGYAAELGHTLVDREGPACHCGRRGCLETEVNLQRLEAAAGGPLDHGDVVASLRSRESEALHAELDRQAEVLARGIANLVSAFNPRLVVLGGFLAGLRELRGEALLAGVAEHTFAPLADSLRIERAALVDDQVLVGAAELAFAGLLADPLGA
ncbi:ROK family transcriptional regulator [Demequina sp. NBRC 110057]|uniref:ROK family transcriptional regulator n=1 Tax=Demequina sp. NBRC 110057 TaxID=1570346 RepID=UPI000A01B028|nr:ROK family transcriptional regulator [Demequina sp. NBRC 110057]